MATLVEIVAYDASWPKHFLEIANELRHNLGANVLAIDHVGSTAVPGLAAKPVIDIDVTLPDMREIHAASAALVALGYEARGNRYDDDVWAFMRRSGTPQQRIYLCPPGNQTHARRLAFRNHLRLHVEAAAAYARLKYELAEKFPYDGDAYTAAKTEFVECLLGKASLEGFPLTAS